MTDTPYKGFLLQDKTIQFIHELYIALKMYPKCERHVLAQETRISAYRILRYIIQASKSRNKSRAVEAADVEVAQHANPNKLIRQIFQSLTANSNN